MILYGNNITSVQEPLAKMPVANIWHAVKNPKPETLALIRQLRIIRAIDYKRYSVLKRQLPYFVCGIFSPPCRRSEHFAYIEYFMLDIDRIAEKQLSVEELKRRLIQDERVMLCFVSPGEDGLKLMFKLEERCFDKGLFALFYKAFSVRFARQYQLEQVLDMKTSDVTRACFFSYDPDAFYRPDAEKVSLKGYVSLDNPLAISDLKRELEQEQKQKQDLENDSSGSAETPKEPKSDVDADIIRNIKAILNPKAAKRLETPVYVPEQLNEVVDDLRKYIEQTGVEVHEIVNIQYGKKIRMRMRLKQAEVNLFFGKRGFSVVKSPRAGTDSELNDLMTGLIQTFINEMC